MKIYLANQALIILVGKKVKTVKKIILLISTISLIGCANSSSKSSITTSSSSVDNSSTSIGVSDSQDDTSISSSSEEKNIIYFNNPNQNAIETTVSDLINRKSVDGLLYRLSGVMQFVQETTYGSFEFSDETGSILVYGLSKNSSCITFNGSTYSYRNAKNFLSTGLAGGDEVIIECVYDIYTYESSGYSFVEIMGYPVQAIDNGYDDIISKAYQENDLYQGNYYDGIGNVVGKQLGLQLHNLMMSTHKTYTSYSSLKNHFKSSDTRGHSTPYCFYSNRSISSLNREHIWPKSLSNDVFDESYAGADIHHLRATESNINSIRGNARFAPMFYHESLNIITYNGGTNNYYGARSAYACFEPADEIKGDVARIIAYVYVHYTTTFGGTTKQGVTGELFLSDVLGVPETEVNDLLCLWNSIDPVDQYEMERNEYAFSVQGNRNPFIDKPSYIDYLFGNL